MTVARHFVWLLCLPLWASAAEESLLSDGEVWNQGVDYYRAGDATNALRVLRPLLLSKTHGARAAEIVAALAYERGELEEAAEAAQVALRESPGDERLNRNFTRAIDGLPQARKNRHINEVLKASQGQDPGALMLDSAHKARELMVAASGYCTNSPARAVALADALSAKAERLSDSWIPLREVIANSVTNEEQAATCLAQIEAAENKTQRAVREFGDLSPEAYASMAEVEHDFTRFLKLTVLPPAALGEDSVAQSNAWHDVETINGREWQGEALDYTRAFRAKFPAWARAYEEAAKTDTNKPPFTAEAQAQVSALATELEKVQLELKEKVVPPSQEKALELIRKIQELLPKDLNGGGAGQPNQKQQSESEKKNDPQPNQNQDQNQSQEQPSQSNDDQNENQSQQEEPQAEAQDEQPQEESPEDPEVEGVLQKAQERNDEHEAEKKARGRKVPLPPNERDW